MSVVSTSDAPSAVGPYSCVLSLRPLRKSFAIVGGATGRLASGLAAFETAAPASPTSPSVRGKTSVVMLGTDCLPRWCGVLLSHRQAIQTDSLVFLSGCIPLVPETMKVIEGGIEEQTVSFNACCTSAQR